MKYIYIYIIYDIAPGRLKRRHKKAPLSLVGASQQWDKGLLKVLIGSSQKHYSMHKSARVGFKRLCLINSRRVNRLAFLRYSRKFIKKGERKRQAKGQSAQVLFLFFLHISGIRHKNVYDTCS